MRVTSPQAFEGLRNSNRKVKRPRFYFSSLQNIIFQQKIEKTSRIRSQKIQIDTLEQNCKEFGITYIKPNDKRHGIVHIIGPEQGFTLPGATLVCGDSHTSTHGAFGCLAFGIGTSEVEHVLATQTLIQTKSKNLKVKIIGKKPLGVTAKDYSTCYHKKNRNGRWNGIYNRILW